MNAQNEQNTITTISFRKKEKKERVQRKVEKKQQLPEIYTLCIECACNLFHILRINREKNYQIRCTQRLYDLKSCVCVFVIFVVR